MSINSIVLIAAILIGISEYLTSLYSYNFPSFFFCLNLLLDRNKSFNGYFIIELFNLLYYPFIIFGYPILMYSILLVFISRYLLTSKKNIIKRFNIFCKTILIFYSAFIISSLLLTFLRLYTSTNIIYNISIGTIFEPFFSSHFSYESEIINLLNKSMVASYLISIGLKIPLFVTILELFVLYETSPIYLTVIKSSKILLFNELFIFIISCFLDVSFEDNFNLSVFQYYRISLESNFNSISTSIYLSLVFTIVYGTILQKNRLI